MSAGKNILKFLSLQEAMKSNRALLKAACYMLADMSAGAFISALGFCHCTNDWFVFPWQHGFWVEGVMAHNVSPIYSRFLGATTKLN